MSMHPAIAAALSEQHRRDFTARDETRRITRAARDSLPAARASHQNHPAADRGSTAGRHAPAAEESRSNRSRQ